MVQHKLKTSSYRVGVQRGVECLNLHAQGMNVVVQILHVRGEGRQCCSDWIGLDWTPTQKLIAWSGQLWSVTVPYPPDRDLSPSRSRRGCLCRHGQMSMPVSSRQFRAEVATTLQNLFKFQENISVVFAFIRGMIPCSQPSHRHLSRSLCAVVFSFVFFIVLHNDMKLPTKTSLMSIALKIGEFYG